jgi:hypothetical protein
LTWASDALTARNMHRCFTTAIIARVDLNIGVLDKPLDNPNAFLLHGNCQDGFLPGHRLSAVLVGARSVTLDQEFHRELVLVRYSAATVWARCARTFVSDRMLLRGKGGG